jgi:hypothetical protein
MDKSKLIKKINKYSEKINLLGGINKNKYNMYIKILKNKDNELEYELPNIKIDYDISSKNEQINVNTNINSVTIKIFDQIINLFLVNTVLNSTDVVNIINDKPKYCIICINSKDRYDITYISSDFMEDFYFDIENSNTDEINFCFNYIGTTIKQIESLLNLLFNQILMECVFKNELINDKIYFLSDNIRNYLDYSDEKFRFDCNHIYIDNDIKINDEINLLFSNLTKLISTQDKFFYPIKNLYNIIKTNKDKILKKCFQIECKIIEDTNFIEDVDDKTKRNEFLMKYLVITHISDTIEIKLFGFRVLYLEFKSGIDKDDFINFEYKLDYKSVSIYYQNIKKNKKYLNYNNSNKYNKKYINKYKFTDCIKKNGNDFMAIYDSCCYNANEKDIEKNENYLNEINKPGNKLETFKFNIIKKDPVNAPDLQHSEYPNLLYIYTEYFSNLTDSLVNNNLDDKYIIYTKESKYETDKTIREVSNLLDEIFQYSNPIENEFHVYRATSILKLLKNDKFDVFGMPNNIDNKYYISTTMIENSLILGNYADIIYPIMLKITIPVGSKVLFLGYKFGQPIQNEILLNRDTRFEYISREWKNIGYNNIYGLVINLKYVDH